MSKKIFCKYAIAGLSALFFMTSVNSAMANDKKYVLISHGSDSDSAWNTFKNGMLGASKDYGVRVDYRNPSTGDLADMARLIEQAAAAHYDGVVTTIADYNVLKNAISKVSAKNIPLVTINSGTPEQSKSLGAIMHIAQPEYDAGKLAGERAKDAGIKSFLCVNHYATNSASFQRCQGFADGIGADMRKSTIDSGQDPTEIQSKVTAYLRQHPDTQAILTLGPLSSEPTIAALKKTGLTNKVYYATFELTPGIIAGLKNDSIKFAIDQQPYLQGYLSVLALIESNKLKTRDPQKIIEAMKTEPKLAARLKEYGLNPIYTTNGVNTGPNFITKDNIGLAQKYAGPYR